VPKLIRPSYDRRESFLAALSEYRAEGRYLELDPAELAADFSGFVARLRSHALRAAPGRIEETIFWLVEGPEFLGRISVRHRLDAELLLTGGHIGYDIRPSKRRRGYGTEILRLALPEARRLGLARVLVTCDEDNEGSRRIIEKNGGALEDIVAVPGRPQRKRRYWIELRGVR
jgi:predicted acetyltransferase